MQDRGDLDRAESPSPTSLSLTPAVGLCVILESETHVDLKGQPPSGLISLLANIKKLIPPRWPLGLCLAGFPSTLSPEQQGPCLTT